MVVNNLGFVVKGNIFWKTISIYGQNPFQPTKLVWIKKSQVSAITSIMMTQRRKHKNKSGIDIVSVIHMRKDPKWTL